MRIGKFASSKAKAWERELNAMLLPYRPAVTYDEPVSVTCCWVFPWRKAESKARRSAGLQPKHTSADVDNLWKIVGDCLQPHFVKDDALIWSLTLKKMWGDRTGMGFRIQTLSETLGPVQQQLAMQVAKMEDIANESQLD